MLRLSTHHMTNILCIKHNKRTQSGEPSYVQSGGMGPNNQFNPVNIYNKVHVIIQENERVLLSLDWYLNLLFFFNKCYSISVFIMQFLHMIYYQCLSRSLIGRVESVINKHCKWMSNIIYIFLYLETHKRSRQNFDISLF